MTHPLIIGCLGVLPDPGEELTTVELAEFMDLLAANLAVLYPKRRTLLDRVKARVAGAVAGGKVGGLVSKPAGDSHVPSILRRPGASVAAS